MLPIPTTTDYIGRLLNVDRDHIVVSLFYEENYPQIELIDKIISCENAIYLLRRSNETCGSHTDTMVSIRRKFIDEYEVLYGSWINDNEEEMY